MPLTDKSGVIVQPAQQRGQSWMLRRESQRRIAQRLFQPGAQPILIAPGNQSEAGRTADRAVGVAMGEPHSLRRQAVQHWRRVVAPPITAQDRKSTRLNS